MNQSLSEVMQNQSNSLITFDTQLENRSNGTSVNTDAHVEIAGLFFEVFIILV